jgi:hypothetical protein
MVTSGAVVAGTLLAGLSLASLGNLELWRVALVGAIVLAAVLLVGLVMRQAAAVMTAPHETTRMLGRRAATALQAEQKARRPGDEKLPLSARVAEHDVVLAAIYENRIGLFRAVAADDLDQALRLRDDKLKTAGTDEAAAAQLQRLDEALWEAGELGRLTQVQDAYKSLLRLWLPIAAIVVVIAAIGIGWLSTPARKDATTQITGDAVVAAVLYLNTGVEPSSLDLGKDCAADHLGGTLVGGTLEEPKIAIPRDEATGCEAAVITVNDEIGVVVPTPSP